MFESEEYRILEKIKDFIKSKKYSENIYIMLRDGHILVTRDYFDMIKADKVNPQDAYVSIGIGLAPSSSIFHYPFLAWYDDFLDAYLSKLGFYNFEYYMAPATGLKYVVDAEVYGDYLSIEVVNLDIAANNTNLSKITFEALGNKLVSGKKELTASEYFNIYEMFRSQGLFAGYNFDKALDIIHKYYDNGDASLVKEATRIAIDYDKIFTPYRVCYNMDNWKEIDCSTIT